jgi:glycine/D-amino acid oxidase-like deaminating enzyme
MTLPVWLDDAPDVVETKSEERYDVVIIGGGVIGAGCAYILSQRHNLKVALVESGKLAHGSSGRNGGFVLRGIQSYYNNAVKLYGRKNAAQIFRFAEHNQTLIKEFKDKYGNCFDYEPCGSYLLACSLEELEELAESADLMREDGFELEFLKEDPLERDYYGAMVNRNDVGINPVKFVRALSSASNAKIFESETVVRIEYEGCVSVQTATRTLKCDRALLATNAYTPLLLQWFVDKIQPARGQVFVTKPLRKQIVDKLCYANYGWEYFRQLSDNRFLLGGCRQLFLNEEVGYADMITKSVQSALLSYLKDRFPDVAGVPIDYRWSGLMGITADGLPLVGESEQIPGLFFAVAFNGHGLGYGLNMSKLLVEMALDGKATEIFDVARPGLSAAKTVTAAGQQKGP